VSHQCYLLRITAESVDLPSDPVECHEHICPNA
jgi:hypothetical protein